jgi:hypothetical protein
MHGLRAGAQLHLGKDMNELSPTASEEFGRWQFKYFVAAAPEGRGYIASAEVLKQRQIYCKLLSVSASPTGEDVFGHMHAKCREWVEDWEMRPHTGSTRLAPLNG